LAKLTLDTAEVAAHLKPLLEQYLSHVQIGIDGDNGFISGKKLFLAVDIRFVCYVASPTNRVTIDLTCSGAAKMGLDSMSASIRNGRPYIESLDSSKCVINLSKIPLGDKMLTDIIDLNTAQIPGRNGLFAEVDFTLKPF
jgi:hypothetical protein